MNTLSFTITYTQDNATTQASAHSGAGWAARLPRMSISSRRSVKPGKIGPISAPQDGRPLNTDTMREGGPISMSAIGRQDVDIDTAPEAARRREERRHAIEEAHMDEKIETEEQSPTEETFEEKVNDGQNAWQEGDNIIIEDDQGEVIRMVRSPRDSDSAREKLERIESRAGGEIEGMKGRLKRMWSGRGESSTERRRSIDLESGIPESSEPASSERPTHQRRSSSISSRLSLKQSPKAAPGPVFMVDEDNRRTAHVNSSTERRAREERDKETEVERRRREAVFGISQDSDEEDDTPRPISSRPKGKQPSSSEEEEEEDPPSSRSGSGGAESSSSGSGAQLLQPPPPARTRGIRFGDISVGQESFSLEEGPPSTGARHHKTGSGDWRVRWGSDNGRNK